MKNVGGGLLWAADRALGAILAAVTVIGLVASGFVLARTQEAVVLVREARAGPELGVFMGTEPRSVRKFGTWLGRSPDYVVDFKPHATWKEISSPQHLDDWKGTPWRLVYAVAMLPEKGATHRAGATGAYDRHFRKLGEHLVRIGKPDAILRIGWEFNIVSSQSHPSNSRDFRAYWRSIVKAFRSVPGQRFEFDWNVVNGHSVLDPLPYFPGARYVDYIGIDSYDISWRPGTYPYPAGCDPRCRRERQDNAWNDILNGDRGLRFWSRWARSQGLPLSFPEWGMWSRLDGKGGGDNPRYMSRMLKFLYDPKNNVAYQAYFNFDGADGPHHLVRSMPQGGKVYREFIRRR